MSLSAQRPPLQAKLPMTVRRQPKLPGKEMSFLNMRQWVILLPLHIPHGTFVFLNLTCNLNLILLLLLLHSTAPTSPEEGEILVEIADIAKDAANEVAKCCGGRTVDAMRWLKRRAGSRALVGSRGEVGMRGRGTRDIPRFGALRRDNTPSPAECGLCVDVTGLLLELFWGGRQARAWAVPPFCVLPRRLFDHRSTPCMGVSWGVL
jgi:hypothetical protein